MGNIVYLQADARYNKYLLQLINKKPLIQIVVEKCKQINADKIIFGAYDCEENINLVKVISELKGVEIIYGSDNPNLRLLNIICNCEISGYMIRVCGDQVLLDTEMTNSLLKDMQDDREDFFYEKNISALLPDIITIEYLKQNYDSLIKFDRYFMGVQTNKLSRKKMKYNMLPVPLRANTEISFRCCKYIVEQNINLEEQINKFADLLIDKDAYLVRSGLLSSWFLGWDTDFFFDEDEICNPWWSQGAIEFVKRKINKEMVVFEYGSGNSTLFFSNAVKKVISVEHDETWFQKMKQIVSSNVDIHYIKLEYGKDYCKKILDYQGVDIVLIDGRDRVNCAKNATKVLNEKGIIIWDDTNRESYREGYEYLKNMGFKRLDFMGLTYGLASIMQVTSIFYRENNVFGI